MITERIEIGKRIKKRREDLGMTQEELGNIVWLNKSTIQRYESGKIEKIKKPFINALAKALDVDPDWILGKSETMGTFKTIYEYDHLKSPEITSDITVFPVIGTIAAGYNELAVEDWSGETIEIPTSYLKGRSKDEFFVLSVHGDSMYPLYINGDKVLILKQSTLNRSGEIGAVIYNGDNATLKKVEYVEGENWMKLIPINPQYPPETITDDGLEQCRVLGIPRLVIRSIE